MELTIEGIRAMKKQLTSRNMLPMYPEKFVCDIFVKDRGWFRIAGGLIFILTLVEDELIVQELTEEFSEMIRAEILAQLEGGPGESIV